MSLWSLTTPVIPKFRPFRSISYGFWVLNFKFKFKNLIFLKWPTFSQFWPDFCQKLIRASFKYTGCAYKILNHFIQPFVLYRGNEIFFKFSRWECVTRDRQVYFAFINLFLCLCTKTTHSHSNLALYSQIIFARSCDLEGHGT